MVIKILGSGCTNCRKLHQTVEQVISRIGVSATVTKVEDFQEIMRYGVMTTPALVVNEAVLSAGRIPDAAQVSTWLTTAAAKEHGAA